MVVCSEKQGGGTIFLLFSCWSVNQSPLPCRRPQKQGGEKEEVKDHSCVFEGKQGHHLGSTFPSTSGSTVPLQKGAGVGRGVVDVGPCLWV